MPVRDGQGIVGVGWGFSEEKVDKERTNLRRLPSTIVSLGDLLYRVFHFSILLVDY